VIPVNEPYIGEEELRNVVDCLKTGWISSAGKFIEQFEQDWARACGVRHGVAVSNGTTALEVAVESLGLGPGDEVIMPTFTIISCAWAVVRAGATPVLVDSDPETWCMDVNEVRERITPKTRAVMPVHMYGHPVDMDPILALARQHNLHVIEDAAEVHGAEYLLGRDSGPGEWRRCGGLGHIAAFSFYANKLITTGEGGMVVMNDEYLAERARSLRNLAFRPPRRFYHTEQGHNYRLTNMQAAVGVAQIRRLDSIVARKREIGARYLERLRDVEQLELPVERSWARNVYWVFGVVLRDHVSFDAEEFARRLTKAGVETRPFFLGMHEQPVFHQRGLFNGALGRYPVAERIARRGLYLPSGVAITNDQIDVVCEKLHGSIRGH
jgi:perosamine synthetase